MDETEIWLRLRLIPHLGTAKLRTLYQHWQDRWADLDVPLLRTAGLTDEQCRAFANRDHHLLTKVQHWLINPRHTLLTLGSARYPAALRALNDAPPLLFTTGDVELLATPQLAIVGSRRPTAYGEQWGDYFAHQLSVSGLTITSGLAVGIDGICHRAALEAGGKTVAVLGSGLNNIYPRCHRYLAEQIVENGGVLISEHLPDTPPLPAHFPQRNRIISGLSLGALVIEASLRSGSLITARHALEQGREVFALPGPLGSKNSEGCHHLIRQGAWLASQPADLLEVLHSSLRWLSMPATTATTPKKADTLHSVAGLHTMTQIPCPDVLADVLESIGDKITPVDVIVEHVGQPLSDVLKKLIELELAGWIAAVSGGYIQRKKAGHVRCPNVPI